MALFVPSCGRKVYSRIEDSAEHGTQQTVQPVRRVNLASLFLISMGPILITAIAFNFFPIQKVPKASSLPSSILPPVENVAEEETAEDRAERAKALTGSVPARHSRAREPADYNKRHRTTLSCRNICWIRTIPPSPTTPTVSASIDWIFLTIPPFPITPICCSAPVATTPWLSLYNTVPCAMPIATFVRFDSSCCSKPIENLKTFW